MNSRRATIALAGLAAAVVFLLGSNMKVTQGAWNANQIAAGTVTAGLAFGSFKDYATQSQSVTYVAAPMSFSDGPRFGITLAGPVAGGTTQRYTQMCPQQAGYYNIQFSSQFTETKNRDVRVAIWLRRGAAGTALTDIPWTGTEAFISSTAKRAVAAWNFIEYAEVGQCFSLMWAVDTANLTEPIEMAALPTPGVVRPEVPSLIVTITQVTAGSPQIP